jgi:hypothetical protein
MVGFGCAQPRRKMDSLWDAGKASEEIAVVPGRGDRRPHARTSLHLNEAVAPVSPSPVDAITAARQDRGSDPGSLSDVY